MASFKMKNQLCVHIFHQSMGSDVLTLPTGLAGRAFRKTSGEPGPRQESAALLGDIWWPFHFNQLQQREVQTPPPHRPPLGSPQTAAWKARVSLQKTNRPAMCAAQLMCNLQVCDYTGVIPRGKSYEGCSQEECHFESLQVSCDTEAGANTCNDAQPPRPRCRFHMQFQPTNQQ